MRARGNGTPGDGSGRIVVRGLSKRFGSVQAVRGLSFVVEPGRVTGFLGPNGAGKTTTIRVAFGLVFPDGGEVTIDGARYDQLVDPARVAGVLLDARGFHDGRRARDHLRIHAAAVGVPDGRVDEVLALVGLSEVGRRKVGRFSLGMRQRLALATALLADPRVLVLDEPGAGLDPEGTSWLRQFLRSYAGEGRTVLVSSHQLAEVAQTVDQLVIISRGVLVYEGSLPGLGGQAPDRVRVVCADPARLATALARHGVTDIETGADDGLVVGRVAAATVGEMASEAGVVVHGLSEERVDLEQRFLELTSGDYRPGEPHPGRRPDWAGPRS